MVPQRFRASAVLLVCLIGCGGQQPAPPVTNPSPVKVEAPGDTTDAKPTTPDVKPAEIAEEKPFQIENGFSTLSFGDFAAFTTDEAQPSPWEETADGVKCTGKPPGYLFSKQSYQNFTWRLEYRFPRPAKLPDESKFNGNTGFLVYITGEHKLWPICLEVQGKHIQMAAIKENGGAQPVTSTDDDAVRQTVRKPVGEWNALEIVSKDGALSVSLNGTHISQCEPDFLSEGLIGIQAEKTPFEVRRMRIRKD